MAKDKGPSPEVIQRLVNLLFIALAFPFLYYFEELIDLWLERIGW